MWVYKLCSSYAYLSESHSGDLRIPFIWMALIFDIITYPLRSLQVISRVYWVNPKVTFFFHLWSQSPHVISGYLTVQMPKVTFFHLWSQSPHVLSGYSIVRISIFSILHFCSKEFYAHWGYVWQCVSASVGGTVVWLRRRYGLTL